MDHNRSADLTGLDAAVYLRKSRMEEGLATEEVLSKHQKTLYDYAAAYGIHILAEYPEVVSGESLYARPQMLRLLQDVEDGHYDAVLCMDLDRLSRGRMKDQGIILDAFRESGTLIITPEKVYNLSDEIDEEYAELKTFISRREYKIITKRLRRGLQMSIQEGCYVANAPYGYHKTVVDRKPTLEIYEPEAKFVRMMFQLYAQGYGCVAVARHVNALGARPHRSPEFSRNSVAKILRNPTYVGKIVWNQKKHIRKGAKGNPKHITIYQPRDQWTITDGLHPAIVDRELFDQVQAIMDGRYQPAKNDGTVRSPLAGLVKCVNCGQNMQRMVMKQKAYLLCMRPGCCSSTQFDLVEDQILDYLEDTLAKLTMDQPQHIPGRNTDVLETTLAAVKNELAGTDRQKNRLYELLELGEYDLPLFRERMAAVKEKRAALEKKEAELERSLREVQCSNPALLAERIRAVLDAYGTADPAGKNSLLKSVLDTVWYQKEKKTKPSDFQLTFTLRAL
ncbi:recombinase family protein [Flintibacter sp. KGMB00164]|uniref:recombinase family protein n=1 Tax=Flintibacter sp. KGMB00164 TaxID=2610895 RepID=UPI0012477B44|nr:recombinase family protein [Flintibacter sp. KGMB00164]